MTLRRNGNPICQTCGRVLLCNEFRWCTKCRAKHGKPRRAGEKPRPNPPADVKPEPIETPEYIVAPPRQRRSRVIYHCEFCDRYVTKPLAEDGRCSVCLTREPDPTPEQIAALCKVIRAEWSDETEINRRYCGPPRQWRVPVIDMPTRESE